MKKSIIILGVLAMLIIMAGCVAVPPTNYYAPFGVTNNPVGSKVGEARDSEGGILQAAQNGGITYISTVDIKYTQRGGVVIKTFVVTGE